MKIEQNIPDSPFYPVTITLESEWEVNIIKSLTGSVNGSGDIRKFTDELFNYLAMYSGDLEGCFEWSIKIKGGL